MAGDYEDACECGSTDIVLRLAATDPECTLLSTVVLCRDCATHRSTKSALDNLGLDVGPLGAAPGSD